VEEMRAEKSEKFRELKITKKRNDTEFEEWFLRYRPADMIEKKQEEKMLKNQKSNKTKSNNKTKTNNKTKSNRFNRVNVFKTKTKKRGRGGLFI
jgi:hypothetical protein